MRRCRSRINRAAVVGFGNIMCSSSRRPPTSTSDLFAMVRNKSAIVLKQYQREDPAMARVESLPRGDHQVVSLVVPGMSPLEPAVAAEFFGDPWPETGVPWYRYTVCAEQPGPVELDGGMLVRATHDLKALRRADTIIIPGWCGIDHPPSEEIIAELRRAHRRGARIASFCTGAFALAAAGLLDGRAATTHWYRSGQLGERYPTVLVDPDVLYVEDDGVFTAAGAAASIDLALHLIRTDHGAEVANTVARHLVVAPHRDGGQAQFIEAPIAPSTNGPDPLLETLDWAVEHLGEELSVDVLAARAAMSPRHFTRRFRAIVGTSPHQWVMTQRLQLARRLLETTDDPIEMVASKAGFGTAAALRLQFSRRLQTTPQAYRRCFVPSA